MNRQSGNSYRGRKNIEIVVTPHYISGDTSYNEMCLIYSMYRKAKKLYLGNECVIDDRMKILKREKPSHLAEQGMFCANILLSGSV